MHDKPRQKLSELIIQYGRSLCDDPRRCEALLKDFGFEEPGLCATGVSTEVKQVTRAPFQSSQIAANTAENIMIRECSIVEARQSLNRLIEHLENGERIALTRRGKTVAILIAPADYAGLAGEQPRPWWEIIEQFQQQGDKVDLSDQEIDSWRDRSPPRENIW